MSINTQPIQDLTAQLGRAGLHAAYPVDFEYYLIALELVSSDDRTIDYLVFPITPSISQNEQSNTNIKKTFGGIASLSNKDFVPKDIVLQGTFGRRLRLLLNTFTVDLTMLRYSTKSGIYTPSDIEGISAKSNYPINNVKSGYGATKILQAIHQKSNSLDDKSKPFRLYLYNPTLGENYLVKSMNLNLQQSQENNTLWNFSMQLKAIAPLEAVRNSSSIQSSLVRAMKINSIEKVINNNVNLLR